MAGDTGTQTPLSLLAQPTIPYSTVHRSLRLPSYTQSIRLLSLDSSKDFDSPLVGTLRVVSLDDTDYPRFNALSYVWGTFATPRDTLKCDTGDFQITTNCKDALCQLRQLYGGITIWVDAICIDQNNNEEKQHQITLMREIYTRAERVYIWIGKETPALEGAIKCLARAARVHHFPAHPARTREGFAFGFQQTYTYLGMLSPLLGLIGIYKSLQDLITWCQLMWIYWQFKGTHFDELFSQEWFLRSWTFQETVLAYDSVIICGSVTIKWDTFARGFRCIDCLFTVWWKQLFRECRCPMSTLDKTIPQSFRVFSGVIDLWMRIKRPEFRHGIQRRLPSSTDLFHKYRKTRCDPQMYFSSDGLDICPYKLLGCVALSISMSFLFGLVIPLLIIGIMYLAFTNVSLLAPILTFLRRGNEEGDKEDMAVLIEGVVQTLRQRKATDPKDKAFALYGILESFGFQLDTPDYGKSQAQIYHELFLTLLRRSSLANILLLDAGKDPDSTGDTAMADAPSWVPSWDRCPALAIPDNYFARLRPGITTESAPHINLSHAPSTLITHGHLKGHIQACHGIFPKVDIDADITSLYKAVETLVTWARATEKKSHLSTMDFNSNLGSPISNSACKVCKLRIDSPNWPDIYFGPRHELLTSSENLRIADDLSLFLTQAIKNTGLQDQTHDIANEITWNLLKDEKILSCFIRLVNNAAFDNRTIFLTSHGYIGHGSKGVAVGDRIALIDGVPAPLILRPHSTSSPRRSDGFCTKYYNVMCPAIIRGVPKRDLGESDYEGEIALL